MLKILQYSFYPLIMGAPLVAGLFLVPIDFGENALKIGSVKIPLYTGILIYSANLMIAILERIMPMFPDWNRSRRDIWTDIFHSVFSSIATTEVQRILTMGVLLVYAKDVSDYFGYSLWPTGWPLLAQVFLFLVLAELPQYWWHRLAHEKELLWRVHSVHHSPFRLYWLNAGRFHPIEIAFSFLIMVPPMVILGAPQEVLALSVIATAVHG